MSIVKGPNYTPLFLPVIVGIFNCLLDIMGPI